MERVKKGERYWFVINDGCGYFTWDYAYEENSPYDDDRYVNGNYFHTKEEAEAMAEKIRKVLKGTDVIEMPSAEEIEREAEEDTWKCVESIMIEREVDYYTCQESFIRGVNWLKSKIIK